jgi:hypothetical protein
MSGSPGVTGPGTEVQGEPEVVALERQRVLTLLEPVADVDAAGLGELYPIDLLPAPSYSAEQLQGLSLIQDSALALNETEL